MNDRSAASGGTSADGSGLYRGGSNGDPTGERPGRLRRALRRFTADDRELEAAELQSAVETAGATAVARCAKRSPVHVAGTVRSVVLRPRGGAPSLEAELYDGSGSVTLVWLGRRRIAGIEPGRSLVAHGRLADTDGHPVIFNPRYELRSTEAG